MSLVRNQVTQLSPYAVSGSTATPVAEPVTVVLESCLSLRFVFDWIRVRNPEGSSCPSAQWELAVRSEAANLNPIMYLILFLLERGGLTSGANSELTLGQPLALAGFAGRETCFAGADVNMSSVFDWIRVRNPEG